jgi:DNA-binding NarL/FixJ family response regulator
VTGAVSGPDDSGSRIGVLIADDEALVRAGFKALLDSASDLQVVGEASDGLQAVRQSRALKPDVILMDIRMPVMDGLEATKIILDSDTRPEQLLEAIRVVAAGEALLAPNVTRRLIAEFARSPRPVRPENGRLAQLTGRELEVLAQVAAGMSNAEAAASLHLSLPTIKTHVSRLLAKLNARDRAQLVVVAYEDGLVTPGQHSPGA